MSAQLDYGFETLKGVPGGKYDLADDEVITRQNEEADGVMKAGLFVKVGTSAGSTVKKPTAGTTAAQIEGVVLAHANVEQTMGGVTTIRKESELGIMKRGNIWARLAMVAKSETDPTLVDVVPVYGATAYVLVSGDFAGCVTPTSGDNTVDVGATFGKAVDNGIAVVVLK